MEVSQEKYFLRVLMISLVASRRDIRVPGIRGCWHSMTYDSKNEGRS
jgi:hypothetical protein